MYILKQYFRTYKADYLLKFVTQPIGLNNITVY